jgi:hypothetical protein
MIDFVGKRVSANIETAIRNLISAEHFVAGSLVTMPVLYPSGSSVVLEITFQQGRYFVSDRGGGHHEAELMGVSRGFAREAERIAEDAGIRFDGRDMFVAEVGLDVLPGAMEVVANSSQMAVAFCAMRASERTERDARDILYHRLKEVYSNREVVKDAEVLGSSSHKWKIAALVREGGTTSLFEPVTNHYTSVVGIAAKFHDLARLENQPRRIAVVRNITALGDFIGVISPAASSIIEFAAPHSTYEKLLAA